MPKAAKRSKRLTPELVAALATTSARERAHIERRVEAQVHDLRPENIAQGFLKTFLPVLRQAFARPRVSLAVDESRVGQENNMVLAIWCAASQEATWLPIQASSRALQGWTAVANTLGEFAQLVLGHLLMCL